MLVYPKTKHRIRFKFEMKCKQLAYRPKNILNTISKYSQQHAAEVTAWPYYNDISIIIYNTLLYMVIVRILLIY